MICGQNQIKNWTGIKPKIVYKNILVFANFMKNMAFFDREKTGKLDCET